MKQNLSKNFFIGLITLLTISFYGCIKTQKSTVYLVFTKFESPATASTGQTINASVQLMYPTTSFPINYIRLQTKSIANNHFAITALGELTSQGQTTQNAAELLIDTTFQIQAGQKGNLILDYMINPSTYKSDTIQIQ